MPETDPEYLDDAEIDAYREALEALRAQLRADLETNADETAVVDLDQPIGRLSRMEAIQQQKMAQATKARVRLRLQLVAAALARIERDDGSFGVCPSCEEPIARARLEARPESPLCIECQSEKEGGRRGRGRRR